MKCDSGGIDLSCVAIIGARDWPHQVDVWTQPPNVVWIVISTIARNGFNENTSVVCKSRIVRHSRGSFPRVSKFLEVASAQSMHSILQTVQKLWAVKARRSVIRRDGIPGTLRLSKWPLVFQFGDRAVVNVNVHVVFSSGNGIETRASIQRVAIHFA